MSAPVILLLAVAAAILLVHVRVFSIHGAPASAIELWKQALRTPATFVTDDAYISFVYSRNLAEHGQLVFNLGEKPVEGYTNFLWTVLLAGLLKLGWLPERASVFFGIACAIGSMIASAWLMFRLRGGRAWSGWDAVPALFLAAVPGYACWSSGGLETQMFTFFLTLGVALYLAPPKGDSATGEPPLRLSSALFFGLAALTRPEGNLFFSLTLLHRGLGNLYFRRRIRPTRNEWMFVAVFAALVVPHFVWRRMYYGWWLPNTFYIKSSGGAGAATWGRGFYYLQRYAEAFLIPAFALLPLASLYRRREAGTNRFYGYAALVLPAFWLYVASVGGDFMGLFRFALPVVPLLLVAAALGLRAVIAPWAEKRPVIAPVMVAGALLLYLGYATSVDRKAIAIGSDNGIDTPGYLKYYTDDRAAIGKWFGANAQPDDYAAVGGAGAQVYFSKLRSLDCFGLSDEYIAHQVRPVDTRPGHQKYAPLDYQLSKKPTIITSNYYTIGNGPGAHREEELFRRNGYHYVSVEIPGLSLPWYTFLKRMDRKLGPLGTFDADLN